MPTKIHYALDGDIAILTLDDGKANTIDRDWIVDYDAAFAALTRDRAAAVLLRARGKTFCAGLDLKKLPTYAPDELRQFVRDYERVKTHLFTLGLPVVGEVLGHALAGGAVLLFCCDWAVTDASPKKIGLNETQVGIALPEWVSAMAQHRLLGSSWAQSIIAGDIYGVDEALRLGFVHEIAPDAEGARERAIAKARALAALPRAAYAASKSALRRRALATAGSNSTDPIAGFFGHSGK